MAFLAVRPNAQAIFASFFEENHFSFLVLFPLSLTATLVHLCSCQDGGIKYPCRPSVFRNNEGMRGTGRPMLHLSAVIGLPRRRMFDWRFGLADPFPFYRGLSILTVLQSQCILDGSYVASCIQSFHLLITYSHFRDAVKMSSDPPPFFRQFAMRPYIQY